MTNKHKKKLHSAAWSPAARRKRAATFARKRAEKAAVISGGPGRPNVPAYEQQSGRVYKRRKDGTALESTRDVIVFLEHAEAAILKSGNKRISAAESYAMLALTTLRGN